MEIHHSQLKAAVEGTHGGVATFVQSVPVREKFDGATVWEGVVHVFKLEAQSVSATAYAWSSPIEDSDRRRMFAVLHMGAIDSPQAAVRAAIVSEYRSPVGDGRG